MTKAAETEYAELPSNPEFDRWCFTTQDESVLIDGKPVPVLTTLMYRVCDSDQAKFEEVLRTLQAAFEAGQQRSSVENYAELIEANEHHAREAEPPYGERAAASARAIRSPLAENARLKEALERIVAWEMPETGDFWPDGTPISYGAQFGSNGERDLVRQWASSALSGEPA